MDKFATMKVFQQIIDTGSFIAASEKLGISKAMTSTHIRNLEDELGVRLINRTSRKISLTNEGRIYYERCREILKEVEETEASLKSSTANPKGLLRVAIPNWFQFKSFTEAIKKYREKYPEVEIDFSLNDRIVDLVEEGIDLALRVTAEPHSNLIARRIIPVSFCIAGSKEYFDKNGRPEKPEDLAKYEWVQTSHIRIKGGIPLKDGDKIVHVEMKQVITANSTIMVATLGASGAGLIILPELLVRDEIIKDCLEVVLPEYPVMVENYLFAVYSSRRYLSPKVRTFIDFMVDWFKKKK
jgi:DNA-binding transcriptional LysR family regulator